MLTSDPIQVTKRLKRILAAPLLALTSVLVEPTALAATHVLALDTSCSGNVHNEAVELWEHSMRGYLDQQIGNGLNKIGDTYVLYNTQEQLQSFVEMTRRCKDRAQISELAETLAPAFDALQPLPGDAGARGWICRGGSTCNQANHLIGKEVQLTSVQFLGLLGALATTIVETIQADQQTSAEKSFVTQTADAIASQLDRWLSPTYFATVTVRAGMSPQDALDGQSKYFFLDVDLWFIDLLSDLSELQVAHVVQGTDAKQHLQSLQAKHQAIGQLIDLFLSRVTLSKIGSESIAEIDRGYWRNYADTQYALYDGKDSPVSCTVDPVTKLQHKNVDIAKRSSYSDPAIGWDFSHARRLVPALNTLDRNTKNLTTVFGYKNTRLDPAGLVSAFSGQIINKIWNKDVDHPLFSNFWDGSNGWYRAGYENGTGCRPGQAPYSLTDSFPTGGYPMWGEHNPRIHELSVRLYQLFHTSFSSSASDVASQAFMKRYYRSFNGSANITILSTRNIWMLGFASSLVTSVSASPAPDRG